MGYCLELLKWMTVIVHTLVNSLVQRQSPEVGVLRNFANLTGEQVCWGLFLTKLQAWTPVTLLKRNSNTSVFLWRTFVNDYFCLFNVVLCGYPGAQRAIWREGVLPCPFLKIEKKFPDFAKKSAYIMEKIMCLQYTYFCAPLG